MLRLKAHSQPLNEYTKIDKFVLVPKKLWDELTVGKIEFKLKGKKVKTRIYDIPCDCNQRMHTHRLIDLRDEWDRLEITSGEELTLEK